MYLTYLIQITYNIGAQDSKSRRGRMFERIRIFWVDLFFKLSCLFVLSMLCFVHRADGGYKWISIYFHLIIVIQTINLILSDVCRAK